LPNHVVSVDTINTFKNCLDKFWSDQFWSDQFWSDQEVLYDYNADLHGIGNRSLLQYCITSIYDSSSISRIQRPLKACFRLLHNDYDDDEQRQSTEANTK